MCRLLCIVGLKFHTEFGMWILNSALLVVPCTFHEECKTLEGITCFVYTSVAIQCLAHDFNQINLLIPPNIHFILGTLLVLSIKC